MVKGVAEVLLGVIDRTLDADRVTMSIFAFDCQANAAGGLALEFQGSDDRTRIVYWRDGQPNLEAESTSNEPLVSGVNAIDVVADTAITIGARDVETGMLVGQLQVVGAPGEYVWADMLPLTSDGVCD